MLDLVLALEAACIGTSGCEGRDEDLGCGAQCLELFCPLRGVAVDEGGEFSLRGVGGDLRGTT